MEIEDAVIRVVDCETTGLNPKEHKVVEIACVNMNYRNGIISSKTQLINPGCKIPLDAMAIHHITDEMVKEAPTLGDAWTSLQNEGGAIDAMAAHNAEFDFSFLKTELPVICSYRLARHLWPNIESHKNQYLRHYLGVNIDPNIPNHRALGDATVTALILQKMLKTTVEEKGINDIHALIKWVEAPVLLNTCYFGKKHHGQKWQDVSVSYLQWMKADCVDLDMDTAYTVDYYLKHSQGQH